MGKPLKRRAMAAAAALATPPRAEAWRVVGASVQGTAHRRGGLPCQDAHGWRALPGGALAVAVADGAGSAPHAEAGARSAVGAALESLAASVHPDRGEMEMEEWTAAIDRALSASFAAVEAEAGRLGAEARDLACTLMIAVATEGGVAAAQIGDGAMVVGDADGTYALTRPESGEFANETVFLTLPGAVEAAQRAAWRRAPLHLAAFTDGLQGVALKHPEVEPHAPFFAPLFRFAAEASDAAAASEQLAEFLSGPRMSARSDDDLTLVLATRGRHE
jgi:serine/threonine protein phosphatase PrpC